MSPSGSIFNSVVVSTNDFEIVKSISQTSDGGYLVCGSVFGDPNDYDWMVLKLNASFGVSWYERFWNAQGSDNANSAFEISQGNYIVYGSAFLAGATKPGMIKFAFNGAVLDFSFFETNQFASPDYRGTFLGNGLIGVTNLANGLSILDTAGNWLSHWNSSLGVSKAVTKTNSGRIAIAGTLNSGPISLATVLTILNLDLTSVISSRSFSDTGDNIVPVEIMEGSNGDIFIAANFLSNSSGNSNPFLIHFDSIGVLFSCHNFNPSTTVNSTVNAAVRTSDGGFLLVGSSGIFGARHLYVVKTDELGNACNAPTQSLNIQFPAPVNASLHANYNGGLPQPFNENSFSPSAVLQPNILCLVTEANEIPASISLLQNNISTNGLYILHHPLNQISHLRCYDLSGKLVFEENIFPFDTQIQTSFQPGSYLFVVSDSSGKTIARQKVIQL